MGKIDKPLEPEGVQSTKPDETGEFDSSEEFLEEPGTSRLSFEIRVGLAVLGILGFVLAAAVAYRLLTLRPGESKGGNQSTETAAASQSSESSAGTTSSESPQNVTDGGSAKGGGSGLSSASTPVAGSFPGNESFTQESPSFAITNPSLGAGGSHDDREGASAQSPGGTSASPWPLVPPLAPNDVYSGTSGPVGVESPGNSGYALMQPNDAVATDSSGTVPIPPFSQSAPIASDTSGKEFTQGWSLSPAGDVRSGFGATQNAASDATPFSWGPPGEAFSGMSGPTQSAGTTEVQGARALGSVGGTSQGVAQPELSGRNFPGDFFAGAAPISSDTGQKAASAPSLALGSTPAVMGASQYEPSGASVSGNSGQSLPNQAASVSPGGQPFSPGAQSLASGSPPLSLGAQPLSPAGQPSLAKGRTPAAQQFSPSAGLPYSPPLGVETRGTPSAVSAADEMRSSRTYTVQQGETLFDIARQQLGKASRWVEIYQLNRDRVGERLENFRPGMTLVLPAEPFSAQPTDRVLRQ